MRLLEWGDVRYTSEWGFSYDCSIPAASVYNNRASDIPGTKSLLPNVSYRISSLGLHSDLLTSNPVNTLIKPNCRG